MIRIRHEIEGRVVFFDGSTLTVDVKEASFAPSANNVTVANEQCLVQPR